MKKRGFFSRFINALVKATLMIVGIISVLVFIGMQIETEQVIVADAGPVAETEQAMKIPLTKPITPKPKSVAAKPASSIPTVVARSTRFEDIKCYAVFSLIRDIYFSTEWSLMPNGTLVSREDYRRITDLQETIPATNGRGPEHKQARLASYDYKEGLLRSTPQLAVLAVAECLSLYE